MIELPSKGVPYLSKRAYKAQQNILEPLVHQEIQGAFSARGTEICCLHIQLNGLSQSYHGFSPNRFLYISVNLLLKNAGKSPKRIQMPSVLGKPRRKECTSKTVLRVIARTDCLEATWHSRCLVTPGQLLQIAKKT